MITLEVPYELSDRYNIIRYEKESAPDSFRVLVRFFISDRDGSPKQTIIYEDLIGNDYFEKLLERLEEAYI